jgi:hypothetical protein
MIFLLAHGVIGFMSGMLARQLVKLDEKITGTRLSLGIIIAVLFSLLGTAIFRNLVGYVN